MKKYVIFSLLIILIIVGFWLYLRSQKTKISPPSLKKGQVERLSDKKTPEDEIDFFVLLPKENKIIYYNRSGATFYEFSLEEGGKKEIAEVLFLKKVFFSPAGNQAVFRLENILPAKLANPFYVGEKEEHILLTWFYDFSIQKAILLSENIQEVTWTLDGQKIVYQYKDLEKNINQLSIADPDGKNWKKMIDLEDESVFLNTLGTGQIVYSTSEKTDRFNLIKTDGTGKKTINLPKKVDINKIVWSSDGKSLIVAIREEKDTDTFYKINIETGQKQEIKYQSERPIEAKNLILTKDGKTLYFTSDDFLYRLSL